MLFTNKTIIPESHLGLLFKNKQFERVLAAGQHAFWDWKWEYEIHQVRVADASMASVGEQWMHLVDLHPEAFAEHVQAWETGEDEVGLVYEKGMLKDIKAPAQRGAYWKTHRSIEVRKVDISEDFKLDKKLARLVSSCRETEGKELRAAAMQSITLANVAEGHTAFLEVDGETVISLKPGVHVWWRFNRDIKVKPMDMRLQNMEVNGQEILTKDKVSLRVNLSATWQVLDAEKVKTELADHHDFLYRELQLALRTVVSTQTLDELLADKNLLNQQVQSIVQASIEGFGLDLKTVGARDIVLPGEMKHILTEVVSAQKEAEANLIRRREETQATRSLHNTAKLMEGNPTLLRLKELEVLQSITENIHELKIYGGLDGLMNGTVKLGE